MKHVIESYGQVIVGMLLVMAALTFLNFSSNEALEPSLKSAVTVDGIEVPAPQFVPNNIISYPGLVDPFSLIANTDETLDGFAYWKTQGNIIYYSDGEYNKIMFQSEFVSGSLLDYTSVDFHDYHCFIDKVKVTAIIKSRISVKNATIMIEEEFDS